MTFSSSSKSPAREDLALGDHHARVLPNDLRSRFGPRLHEPRFEGNVIPLERLKSRCTRSHSDAEPIILAQRPATLKLMGSPCPNCLNRHQSIVFLLRQKLNPENEQPNLPKLRILSRISVSWRILGLTHKCTHVYLYMR